ncbi:MAG TPA: hypothetical protein VMK31_05085 [Sphingomicrobium sp.]|nr:hypothetical protein [Sphingomicrobium sp.]
MTIGFARSSAALMLAASIGLSACQVEGDGEPAQNVEESTLNLPQVPLPPPPMGRSDLLAAIARAASATAAGTDDSAEQRSLAGSRFELRIRFGCRGPAPDLTETIFGWTFDQKDRTLRVLVTPTISSDDPIVSQFAGEDVEAAEGFWIPRPWLLEPVCPAAAAVRPDRAQAAPETDKPADEKKDTPEPVDDEQESQAPPPASPKVGIVQFFTESDPRTRRRGMRPYETVKTLRADEPLSSQGFNLVLAGRIRPLPGQKPIVCVSRGSDQPPDCLVSARIDRVRIERPDTKEILAEWGAS